MSYYNSQNVYTTFYNGQSTMTGRVTVHTNVSISNGTFILSLATFSADTTNNTIVINRSFDLYKDNNGTLTYIGSTAGVDGTWLLANIFRYIWLS